ncbi:MAG: acyl-ACP--UDP-N-acetylglucosamine O-acyltransferase [Gammaproteobacteria bacterium]
MIDPDAKISQDALIAEGVTVGAGSIIGAGVEIGSGTKIGPHVVINGPTKIGKDNKIYQFASIGEDPQDKKFHGEINSRLEIGDRNTIREFCTFNRGTEDGGGVTKIADDNWIMAYVHIAHDCLVGNSTVFANGTTLAGHVEIGDHAILGGNTMVHQFCKIGAHTITRFSTGTSKDIPPYMVAAWDPAKPKGINREGLKRRDFSSETIESLRQAFKIIYRNNLTIKDACTRLDEMIEECPEIALLQSFIANSERGIIR